MAFLFVLFYLLPRGSPLSDSSEKVGRLAFLPPSCSRFRNLQVQRRASRPVASRRCLKDARIYPATVTVVAPLGRSVVN